MRHFFTISDFANLRNININSLRYYERIGLLTPSYIDSGTGYRYYSTDQLSMLDIISLCIDLEIPLRDLTEFKNEEIYQNKELLESYKTMADRKIRDIQNGFKKMEFIQRCREEQTPQAGQPSPYPREIRTRYLFLSEYNGSLNDDRAFEKRFRELFQYTQDLGLTPVMSAGYLLSFNGNEPPSVQIYHEVLTPEAADEADTAISDRLMKLPTMVFSCLCMEANPRADWVNVVRTQFPYAARRIALLNKVVQYEPMQDHEWVEIQTLDGFQTYSH